MRRLVEGRAAAFLVAALACGCGPGPAPSIATTVPPSSPGAASLPASTDASPTPAAAATDPPGRQLVADAEIDIGIWGADLHVGDEGLWALGSQRAQRIDPASNEVATTIDLPAGHPGLGAALGGGSLWIPSFDLGTVVRLDAATAEELAVLSLGGSPETIEVAFGSAWVSQHRAGTVTRIDLATNEIGPAIKVALPGPGGPSQLTATPDRLWVAVPSTRAVVGIDPLANAGSGSFKVAESTPCGVAAAASRLWVLPCFEGALHVDVIDPDTLAVGATIPMDRFPYDPVEMGELVWIPTIAAFPPRPGPGRLLGVDPATGRVVDVVELPAAGSSVVAFGSLWVADAANPRVLRFDPAAF